MSDFAPVASVGETWFSRSWPPSPDPGGPSTVSSPCRGLKVPKRDRQWPTSTAEKLLSIAPRLGGHAGRRHVSVVERPFGEVPIKCRPVCRRQILLGRFVPGPLLITPPRRSTPTHSAGSCDRTPSSSSRPTEAAARAPATPDDNHGHRWPSLHPDGAVCLRRRDPVRAATLRGYFATIPPARSRRDEVVIPLARRPCGRDCYLTIVVASRTSSSCRPPEPRLRRRDYRAGYD